MATKPYATSLTNKIYARIEAYWANCQTPAQAYYACHEILPLAFVEAHYRSLDAAYNKPQPLPF